MEAMNRPLNRDNSIDSSAAETLRRSAGVIKDEVSGIAHEVKGVATDQLNAARAEGSRQLKRLEEYVRDRPLTALAISLGVGLVAGAMYRSR